jgi:dihydroneopterin aldolase
MIDRPGDDLDPDEGAEPGDFDEELGDEPVVTVNITGLSIYTHHGVGEAEREVGQRLVFDISFELDRCDATVTDRLDDTVDYGDVCQQVALAAQERSYRTLERLCSRVADRMIERYGVDQVSVRAAKPEPPIALPVDEVAVAVFKERAD